MANPQPTDAHLRIAHSIEEQLMVSYFTEQQRRILDLILRLSWGCGKKAATIPHQNDFQIVGVGESHIKQHINWLIEARVITRDSDQYSFNKDFDQWRVSRSFYYTKEKLAELIYLNLNHNDLRNTKVGLTENGSDLRKTEVTENGSLTENGRNILPKTEESTYVKGKNVTPNLATAKEKERNINKDSNNISVFNNKENTDLRNTEVTEYGSFAGGDVVIVRKPDGAVDPENTMIQYQSLGKIRRVIKGEVPALESNKRTYREILRKLNIPEIEL